MDRKYKVNAELDLGELEVLFDLFHREITKNRELAKADYLAGEISKNHLDWHLGHAKYIESIKKKITYN